MTVLGLDGLEQKQAVRFRLTMYFSVHSIRVTYQYLAPFHKKSNLRVVHKKIQRPNHTLISDPGSNPVRKVRSYYNIFNHRQCILVNVLDLRKLADCAKTSLRQFLLV